jgi:hypothetical protein
MSQGGVPEAFAGLTAYGLSRVLDRSPGDYNEFIHLLTILFPLFRSAEG